MTQTEIHDKWVELDQRLATLNYQLLEAIITDEEASEPFGIIVKEMLALGGEFEVVARDLMQRRSYTPPE